MNKQQSNPPNCDRQYAQKIQAANLLRRKAFLRREQAKTPKHPSEVGRLINDAATMEQNAERLEQEARAIWRAQ